MYKYIKIALFFFITITSLELLFSHQNEKKSLSENVLKSNETCDCLIVQEKIDTISLYENDLLAKKIEKNRKTDNDKHQSKEKVYVAQENQNYEKENIEIGKQISIDTSLESQLSEPVYLTENFCIEPYGKVEMIYIEKCAETLSVIPSDILNAYAKQGWHFYITDEDLDKTMFNGMYGSVQGGADGINKFIKIEDRNKAVVQAPMHEFGHFLDYYDGSYTIDEEFENIYSEEINKAKEMGMKYGLINSTEYFADSFEFYIKDRERMKEYIPKTYEYIEQKINDLLMTVL